MSFKNAGSLKPLEIEGLWKLTIFHSNPLKWITVKSSIRGRSHHYRQLYCIHFCMTSCTVIVTQCKYLLCCLHYNLSRTFCTFQDIEEFLSNLVVDKTIQAKIDRLEGIVNFTQQKDPNDILNDWSFNINTLMQLVNKTTHLITKEEMVHKLA